MMERISQRVQRLQPSGTLAMSQRAKELASLGRDVIDLSVGEPDFATPEPIRQAAIEALQANKTDHYTPTPGILPLRQAIAAYHQRKDGVEIDPKDILVVTGAKFALYSLFQTLLNPGDGVIVPVPYWVSYYEQIRLAEGQIILAQGPEPDFKLTPEILEAVYQPHAKILLLNSPNNPSGQAYNRQELEAICQWAVEKGLFIVSDEIYNELVYEDQESLSVWALSPQIRDHAIIVNGLSKSVSMTGWRFGYLYGPHDLIQAMVNLTTHSTGNATAVVQYAAIAAFDPALDELKEERRQELKDRRDVFYQALSNIPNLHVTKPVGAFYCFVNVEKALRASGISSCRDLALDLLDKTGVATVSGDNFGLPGYLRLSYAKPQAQLLEAAKRMASYFE